LGVLLKICDFVFVLRPLILIPAWSFYLVGAAKARGQTFAAYAELPAPIVVLCLTSILVSAYLLNQIFDKESDEKNDKLFYLSRGIFRTRTLLAMAVVFFVIASLSFQEVAERYRLPLIGALALSLLYSLPPVRLCARPFLDMAANAFGYGGIAFIIGFLVYDYSSADALVGAIPYILLVASTFIHTTILDIVGDRAAGKISTAVFVGERPANAMALILHVAGTVAALIITDWIAVIITAATLPATIYALRAHTKRASSLQIQITTLAVTLAAIIFWPAYALVVAPLLIVSRFYYAKRFGITYPGPQKNV